MKYYEKSRSKDFRRVGCVFHDDTFVEESPENLAAFEHWKSVVTELHQKNMRIMRSQVDSARETDPAFASDFQQEYSSDTDEVCSSVFETLDRLIELSKEQKIEICRFCTLDSNQSSSDRQLRNFDGLSIKSNTSEANNLVEEVIMKNARSNEITANVKSTSAVSMLTDLGRFLNVSSADVEGVRTSQSDQHNLYSVTDLNAENSSLGNKLDEGAYVKNNKKTEIRSTSLEYESQIIVAIDIGSTYSGCHYAVHDFASTNTEYAIQNHDVLQMQKVPSILLLNSRLEFHSFGHDALNYFLNIEHNAATLQSQWLLFEKFKMQMMSVTRINRECQIKATNGISVPALIVYTHTLNYFKNLVLRELSRVLQKTIKLDHVRWVITVPVMWSLEGKMFIREAAFNAGLCTAETANRLNVIYECEASATSCNILHWNSSSFVPHSSSELDSYYFLVVNCGGGTVDVTVHYTNNKNNCMVSEVQKFSEPICSSSSVNEEFLRLFTSMLGKKFMNLFQLEKPASWIDLMYQFEAFKASRSANILCRWQFCEFYRKVTGKELSQSIQSFDHKYVTWNENGFISLNVNILKSLFKPLVLKIVQFIKRILHNRSARKISRIYFTGGLIKTQIFQQQLRSNLQEISPVIFFQNDASDASVLIGAVYRLKYENFKYSKLNYSYAIGVVKEFQDEIHPLEKLVLKHGQKWCCDLLDWLVRKDQILQDGEVILKRYTRTASHQSSIVINIYVVEQNNCEFVTDSGVRSYGVLRLSTTPTSEIVQHEILLQLIFTGNEFIVNALDTLTNCCDQIRLDNLSYL